jgi:DNA-binding transcriptional MerR regulator
MTTGGMLRIGEVSKRSGVSPELLRAWESRYGLLHPTRSPGGLRLYSDEDIERVRLMQENLARGLAAAEAAALATQQAVPAQASPAVELGAARRSLADALDRFDEPAAQAVLDQLLGSLTLDTLLAEIVLPYLHELGERWERGTASVGQEHFASGILRGRMLALARGWGRGVGPLALLACLPDERHELGLLAFGLALRARGWRIAYLGADTPVATIEDAAASLEPAYVVVNAASADRVDAARRGLRRLAKRHRVALGGAGSNDASARGVGAIALTGGPVEEADRITLLAEATPTPA